MRLNLNLNANRRFDRIWNDGYERAKAGEQPFNPFASGTKEAAQFEQGWMSGRFARTQQIGRNAA